VHNLRVLEEKVTLFYTTNDKQKGHMGTPDKNISTTLLISARLVLKEKVMRMK